MGRLPFLEGHGSEDLPQHREMTQAAGFDMHLVKPILANQLQFVLSMTQP